MKIYLAKIVPIAYIVSIVTACYICDKVSSYFVFLNSVELTSVNLDSLRSLKAPSESITYALRPLSQVQHAQNMRSQNRVTQFNNLRNNIHHNNNYNDHNHNLPRSNQKDIWKTTNGP